MNILLWIIFGGLAGYLASVFMRTEDYHSILVDILLGVAGSVVGGFLFNLFGAPGANGFNGYSLVVAIVGATALIWLRRIMIRDI